MLVFPTFFVAAKPPFDIPRMSQASLREWRVTGGSLLITGRTVAGRVAVFTPSPVMASFSPRGLWVG
jgi:hypothetical protein